MALRTDTSDKLERTGLDADKRYFGKYLGYVRDNLDPERRGRVRVYCPEVMGEVDNARTWLGWGEAEAGGSGYDQGFFSVPTMPEDTPRDVDDPTSPCSQTRTIGKKISKEARNPGKEVFIVPGFLASSESSFSNTMKIHKDNYPAMTTCLSIHSNGGRENR